MSEYVIIHGTVRVGSGTGPDAFKRIGDTVEMDPAQVAEVDPQGVCFVTPERFEKLQMLKEAQAELAALSDDEKQEAAVEFVATKKGKKSKASEVAP